MSPPGKFTSKFNDRCKIKKRILNKQQKTEVKLKWRVIKWNGNLLSDYSCALLGEEAAGLPSSPETWIIGSPMWQRGQASTKTNFSISLNSASALFLFKSTRFSRIKAGFILIACIYGTTSPSELHTPLKHSVLHPVEGHLASTLNDIPNLNQSQGCRSSHWLLYSPCSRNWVTP